MPAGAPDPDLWPVFVAELERVAASLGVAPIDVKRRLFLERSAFGKRFERFGGWSAVRARAADELTGTAVDRLAAKHDHVAAGGSVPLARKGSDVAGEDAVGGPAPSLHLEGQPFPIVPPGTRLKEVSSLVNGQWVKTEPIRLSPAEMMERALERASDWIDDAPPPVPCPAITEDDLMGVYAIGDMHHGMRAWAGDGGGDWDMAASEAIHREAMAALVEEGPPARRALIVNVGDALHVDNNSNATNRSKHPLDLSARWAESFHSLLRLKIYMIECALRRHASVAVEIVAGNHDEHSAIMLSAALDQRFHAEPRVHVSLSSQARRYHRFGKCLVGVAHGHLGKIRDLGEIMSVDRQEDWGETLHRLWITGHTHHTERIELRGCVVEILRTLAPNDHHSQGEGYRSGREMVRINMHREWGERGRQIVPAAYLEQRIREAS